MNFLCEYAIDQKYDLKFALEAKPNEPRGDLFLPTTGHMLAFIYTLDHPDMVGVNPEVAHEQMSGLDFSHGVGQALDAGKLFHIDLNGQKPSRFDQDLRFGSEDQKGAFFLVKLLEDAGWSGMRHFDSHPYRTEDEQGVWDFAYYSMRTYLILKEKAARFNADKEIGDLLRSLTERGLVSEGAVAGLDSPLRYGREQAAALKAHRFDVASFQSLGSEYERLDQLTTEVLLGIR
jgi:xylose isomerase